jgi:hypothetical protein
MPGCPLRNACVRPLEMGQVDQKPKPSNSKIKRSKDQKIKRSKDQDQ